SERLREVPDGPGNGEWRHRRCRGRRRGNGRGHGDGAADGEPAGRRDGANDEGRRSGESTGEWRGHRRVDESRAGRPDARRRRIRRARKPRGWRSQGQENRYAMARAESDGRRVSELVSDAALQATAQPKFACPACGGEAVWNPARAKLVCPFCGTESPAQLTAGGTIVEHDLVAALRAIPDAARGWRTETRQVRCQSCNAISVLDPSRQAQTCAFCGSAQLVAYTETKPAFRPESVLPFRLSDAQARDGIRAWYGRLWLAPGALKRRALTDTVRGVYLPYWTFDAEVEADWTADAGHYYYESETYVVNGETRTRQVQRIRWEPAAGHVSHFFDDDLVCASV